jgi:hypothetical protein
MDSKNDRVEGKGESSEVRKTKAEYMEMWNRMSSCFLVVVWRVWLVTVHLKISSPAPQELSMCKCKSKRRN